MQFVTSLHRSDCFRLERQLPGGIRTRWDTAPFHGARRTRAITWSTTSATGDKYLSEAFFVPGLLTYFMHRIFELVDGLYQQVRMNSPPQPLSG